MQYKAFISYSHAADKRLAPAIQSALNRFAKPWYRRRALRIYRDKTSLSLTASLWPTIEKALSESEYFILLASPGASASQWVQQEIDYWINNRSPDNLLIVVTDGNVQWDKGNKDFDWSKTTALPENLKGIFIDEPLWLDLRWAKKTEHLDMKHPRFRDGIARASSTLHNMPLDEISGEEVRQHRNTMKVVWSAVIMLTLLLSAAIVFAVIAENRRKEAERQSYISISQALAAYAPREQEIGRNDELAALLALQAYIYNNRYKSERQDYVDEALRQVLEKPFFSIKLSGGKEKPRLTSATFCKDNKYLAVGGYDMKVRIWNLINKTKKPLILNQPYGIIQSLEFNPKKNILTAGTENGYVLIWKYRDGGTYDSLQILEGNGEKRVTSITFNKEGKLLGTGSFDGTIRIWDLDQIQSSPVILSNQGINKPIKSLAFHPRMNNIIVSGGDDETLRFWNLDEPDEPFKEIPGFEDAITAIAYSNDEHWLAIGNNCSFKMPSLKEMSFDEMEDFDLMGARTGGDIYLWDLKKNKNSLKILEGHDDAVTSLSFSPDAKFLASAGNGDQTVRLWELDSLDKPPEIIHGNESLVSKVTFSKNGRFLASVHDNESTIRLWDMEHPSGAPLFLTGHQGSVRSLEFNRFNNYLFSGGREDGTIRIWDIDQPNNSPIVFENEGTAEKISLHPKGKVFAVGYGSEMLEFENQIILRYYNNSKDTIQILTGHKSPVKYLSYDHNGKLLVSAGEFDKEIWIWDPDKIGQEEPDTVFKSLSANVRSLALGRKSQILAWGGDDGLIRVINNFKAEPDSFILNGHASSVNSLLFIENDEIIISGGRDGKILAWDLNSRVPEPVTIEKFDGKIFDIATDSTESILASSGSDGYIRIHNLKDTEIDPMIFEGLEGNIYSVSLSRDGKWIASGSSKDLVMVWPLTKILAEQICKKIWRNLTQDEWNRFIGSDIPYECSCTNLPSGEVK